MRHVLIVDDTASRHEGFRKILSHWLQLQEVVIHSAFTVREAQITVRQARFPAIQLDFATRKIIEPDPIEFAAIFLDHDCDNKEGPDFIEFARYMVESRDMFLGNPNVMIHSHNDVGAENMRNLLVNGGWNVKIRRFEAP